MSRHLRVGRIGALNMYPIYHGLERATDRMSFTDGTPTELNNALLRGELDVSAVSSVAYARNADRLSLVPVASISARGALDSIQLFSSVPFERVETVAVTPDSATSVLLLRLLLGSGPPPFEMLDGPAQDALRHVDGVLLIGDEALEGLRRGIAAHQTDLAHRWHALTGQPMVFAVWAARAEVAREAPDELRALAELIRGAQAQYAQQPAAVVDAATERFPVPREFIRGYLGRLSYGFGPAERAGLQRFLDSAERAGLLRSPAEPHRVGLMS